MEREFFWLSGDPDYPAKLITELVKRQDGRFVRLETLGSHAVVLKTGSAGFVFPRDYIERIGEGSFTYGIFKLAKLGIDSSGMPHPNFDGFGNI